MTEDIKYSVIIPVYNSEKTIKRCLESVLYQIPYNAELLVINDGSSDSSGSVCQEFAEVNQQIRYFEKENGGVSSARNLGLDHARGEYILFVDSDDYVADEYWQTISQIVEKYEPDMLQYGFKDCGKTVRERSTGDYVARGKTEVAKRVNLAMREYMFSALWAHTFKRDIIEKYDLRFNTELAIGEDQSFIFAYAMHIENLVSVSRTLYMCVLENEESLSRKRRDYLADQLMEVNQMMLSEYDKAVLDDSVRTIYDGAVAWVYYRSAYSAFKELLKYDLTKTERRKKIKEICKMYNIDGIKPKDIKCWIIALPVIYKMSGIIDILINQAR